MKIHKKMLVAGLILIMLLAISGCGRKNIKIALYQYTENEDGTLTITALTDKGRSEDELVVPAVLDGKSVSTIGDNWKDRILNGTKKAEFAIIVISENFFDREWTERELAGFLNRQNRNGQKLILPILHNITTEQLKAKYPLVADIQAIDSAKYSCDQIALLFARQLIKRLKNA